MPPQTPAKPSGCIVFGGGGFLALIAVFVVVFSARETFVRWQLSRDVSGFSATTGEVTHSQVRRRSGGDGPTHWDVSSSVTYVVDGEEYSGNDHQAPPSFHSEAEAYAWQARYPQGGTIEVFYDPAEPTRMVLSRDVSLGTWELISSVGYGVFFIALFVTAVGLYVRRRRAAG